MAKQSDVAKRPAEGINQRDWQAELPFLDWSPEGTLFLDYTPQGEYGYRCKDGTCIPFSDPRLSEYSADHGPAAHFRREMRELRAVADEIHESITDLENDEPIPLEILRKDPAMAAWLHGEMPGYAPTVFELHVLLPAFIERRRKLRERPVQVVVETANNSQTPALPVCTIDGDNSTIEYGGVEHQSISFECAILFQELVEAYPERKGLTTPDRPQPRRMIAKLPEPLRILIDTDKKGSVLRLQ